MRILGLDIGDKRCGVAINDPMGWGKAQPLMTIETEFFFDELPKVVKEYKIEKIVVGIPQSDGITHSAQAKKIEQFSEKIKQKMKLKMIHWDETLSSKEAEEFLITMGVSRKKRKFLTDKIAATLILQSYLNH